MRGPPGCNAIWASGSEARIVCESQVAQGRDFAEALWQGGQPIAGEVQISESAESADILRQCRDVVVRHVQSFQLVESGDRGRQLRNAILAGVQVFQCGQFADPCGQAYEDGCIQFGKPVRVKTKSLQCSEAEHRAPGSRRVRCMTESTLRFVSLSDISGRSERNGCLWDGPAATCLRM